MIDIVETLRQGSLSRDDYRWIAAEEITRLRAETEDYKRWAAQVTVEANEEVSSLRSDNERLRAALKPILNYPNIREKIGNQLYGLGCAALEAKHISEADGQPAPSVWRPIDTAPKDGSRMLLAYRNSLGKWRRVIAFYAPKFAIEGNDYGDDWCEYDEASDRYFLPEGWYECIENWDDYSSVHMSGVEPTHWMPLPPAPGKEGA